MKQIFIINENGSIEFMLGHIEVSKELLIKSQEMRELLLETIHKELK